MTKPFEPLPCPDAKIYIDLTKLSMCKIWLICVLPMALQITPVLILASLNAPWVTAQDLDWPKSPPVKRPNYWVVTCNICNQQWQSLNLASQWFYFFDIISLLIRMVRMLLILVSMWIVTEKPSQGKEGVCLHCWVLWCHLGCSLVTMTSGLCTT